MGKLALPSAGLVYLDTSALIYSVERHALCRPVLDPVWAAPHDGQITWPDHTSELQVGNRGNGQAPFPRLLIVWMPRFRMPVVQ